MNPFTVVLCRSQGAFNVGATARAMENMGLTRLVLIAPQCEIDVAAREGAASAQATLARRIVYSSLEEFYANEGEGLRLSFTRRQGQRRTLYDFASYTREQIVPLLKEPTECPPIYLFFGSENDGLTQEEIDRTNACVSLPTYGKNGSLNLGQAVLIALFTLRNELAQAGLAESSTPGETLVRGPLEFPQTLITEWLTTLGFTLNKDRRKDAFQIVNALLLRACPNSEETRILTDILFQTIRKLKERADLLKKANP